MDPPLPAVERGHAVTLFRYHFAQVPADDLRIRVAEWLRFHGIDPDHVIGRGGWIERDTTACAVRALTYPLAADGIGRDFHGREVVESRSEGPPMPFPALPPGQWLALSTHPWGPDGQWPEDACVDFHLTMTPIVITRTETIR